MPLPRAVRSRLPDRLKDDPRLRALALSTGLINPRPMHSAAEGETLMRYATGARCVVELGVYEGSSAVELCQVLGPEADLHLVDPFIDESGWALPAGWNATPAASRRAVARQARNGGPRVHWHRARSQDIGRAWNGPPVDFVFIDGDHSPEGCREDWEVWHPHFRPGGAVAFHDARLGAPDGDGSPGPTQVVDAVFRSEGPPDGWQLTDEVDTLVVAQRSA